MPQALWVAARAARLPEADGERVGRKGIGRPIRLLVLGDSSAAGVGVTDQSETRGGKLSDALAAHYAVEWNTVARSGGTVRSTQRTLEDLSYATFDIVLVALGINDAKNGVSLRRWSNGYRQLPNTHCEKFQTKHICVSGLPLCDISHYCQDHLVRCQATKPNSLTLGCVRLRRNVPTSSICRLISP